MDRTFAFILFALLLCGCVKEERRNCAGTAAGHEDTLTDSVSDPLEWHISRTRALAEEKSLYQKYLTASENASWFASKKMPLELGRNLEALGNVMAQLSDTVRALDYYGRAEKCFREASAARDLYENRIHRSNAVSRKEGEGIFRVLLADTAVTGSPELHARALKGAYLSTDSLVYLDSCLALLDRDPSALPGELPTLLALKADECLGEGNVDEALARIPGVKAAIAACPPIAQNREYIHSVLGQTYFMAGMKDSCIRELLQVIWWTDSAYREANLPSIYSRETRSLIDMTERNARLERRAMELWWAVSALALLALAIWLYYRARRRQAAARHEIELLDSRLENITHSHTAQAAVMEENHRLVAEIREAVTRNAGAQPERALAADILRILNLYSSHEENRKGFLTVSRDIDSRFSTRLKADFPALSEAQLRLAALIAAGVDSRQLASILNISSKSLYTSRYRLRSQLGLSKSDSLEDFLRRYASPCQE